MRADQALAAAVAAGVAPRDARLLLARALGCGEASLMAHADRVVPEAVLHRFGEQTARRARGEPVAYLLGEREFFSLMLEVSPAVLIPRPETETLVEAALERLASGGEAAVLDLGTGSGAIALAIKQARPRARVVAVDASAAALAVARRNAARHGLDIAFRQGAWFSPLPGERFDLVVSNPPYVAEGDRHLGGDLRHEPREALAAGVDGLSALQAIIAAAPAALRPGGWLLLEHGMGQDGAVAARLARAGFESPVSILDGVGIARVAAARLES